MEKNEEKVGTIIIINEHNLPRHIKDQQQFEGLQEILMDYIKNKTPTAIQQIFYLKEGEIDRYRLLEIENTITTEHLTKVVFIHCDNSTDRDLHRQFRDAVINKFKNPTLDFFDLYQFYDQMKHLYDRKNIFAEMLTYCLGPHYGIPIP